MIKTLAKYIGEYKKSSVLTPCLVVLEVIMEVFIPFMMASLIDKGITPGDMGEIVKYGVILIISAMLALVFGALAGSFGATASAGFAKNLREALYDNIQNFSFFNIDKFSTSSLVTRMTTDITNIQNAYQMLIRIAVRTPVMFIFAFVMSFKVNHELAMIFVYVVPILIIGLAVIIKFAHPIFEKIFKIYDKLNLVVQENLHGIRVVKSFVRENFEINKFNSVADDIYKKSSKAEKLLAFNGPLMQFVVFTCIILISWFSAKMIVGGSMETGELMSMISYAMQILMSLMMLSMVFVMITMSRASCERVSEVLMEKSDITNKENPVTEVKNGEIVFDHVNFSYSKNPEKLCLKDINLRIKSGETIGVIGGTGSAKSSLVQLIPRLYDVTSGKVTVGGLDVRDYDMEVLRDNVSMVLQQNVLFSGTIKENLRWGNENASDEEIIRVCKLAQADSFIETFPKKYDTYIEQGGTNVSGGQKQRLCIARALLKKPKILILDDSTSAVDTKTDALIRTAFAEEIPDTTKIIIAQRVSSVMDADKIVVMENGEVNAFGTHEELLKTNEIYRQVYYSQTKEGDEA